jgi:hypothetical protein
VKFEVIQRENKMAIASQERGRVESSKDRQQMVRLKSEIEDFAWKGLFRFGGIAALMAVCSSGEISEQNCRS